MLLAERTGHCKFNYRNGLGCTHCCLQSWFLFVSVQIDLPPTMYISRGLPGLYTAVQMHLHWGGLDLETSGSEHTIDGMRYFAEVFVNGAGWRVTGKWKNRRGMWGGWCDARAQPDGAGTEGSKTKSPTATAYILQRCCSSAFATNPLN